jgi:large subunit ribosomal protein L41
MIARHKAMLTCHAQLTPFVDASIEKVRINDSGTGAQVYPARFTGQDYLAAWKRAGGHDIVEEPAAPASATRTNMPEPFEEKPAR